MKTIMTVILAVLCSSTVFANEEIQLQGTEARVLLTTLEKIGAVGDTSAGTYGTTASEIFCTKAKHEENGSICDLKVQDENGGQSAKHLTGELAEDFVQILIDADVVGCGMESCQGQAATIDCTHTEHPEWFVENSCTIGFK